MDPLVRAAGRLAPSRWAVGIVIPARNEEDNIALCVRSAIVAAETCSLISAYWIVVIADSCSDLTAAHAIEALGVRGEVIACDVASAGAARRIGAQAALNRFAYAPPSNVWLANTDADSEVPADWLEHQLSYAGLGTAAVAGMVSVASVLYRGREVVAKAMADYGARPDGTHTHVHGANLGIRADAYLDVGGWSDASLAEDHCLWNRVRRRGWPVMSSAATRVRTSGRLTGRARGGFADTLRHKLETLCG
jgi:cellulose synthase/poly-beta-1,6-N-acetylglucosamine synthase-like glycosyltransferase